MSCSLGESSLWASQPGLMRYNIKRLVCTVHTFCIGPLIVAINMSEFLYSKDRSGSTGLRTVD